MLSTLKGDVLSYWAYTIPHTYSMKFNICLELWCLLQRRRQDGFWTPVFQLTTEHLGIKRKTVIIIFIAYMQHCLIAF